MPHLPLLAASPVIVTLRAEHEALCHLYKASMSNKFKDATARVKRRQLPLVAFLSRSMAKKASPRW